MKPNAPTSFVLIAVATFIGSMVPTVQARPCSNATAAGSWSFTVTGTFFFPSPIGSIPLVNLGILTFDEAGNLVGTQTRNVGGAVGEEKVTGTLSLDPDCTGTVIARAFDPSSGALMGTAFTKIVLDDNARQMHALITEELDSHGRPFPGVVSGGGERVFAKGEGDEDDGCTPALLKGSWGSVINGTIIGVGPIAVLGVTKFDGEGHFSMDATANIHGNVSSEHTTGTYTVNRSCTGTTTDSIGDSSTFVIVGDGKEIIAVSTKPGLVATLQLRKQGAVPSSPELHP
jgi:hypothetical protein